MKELQTKFNEFKTHNPHVGDWINLNRFIWSTPKVKWDRKKILNLVNNCVDIDDYEPSEKSANVDWLMNNLESWKNWNAKK